MKLCLYCGRPIVKKGKKYCNLDCKGKAYRLREKERSSEALKQAREGTKWL
jgi:hypothetical protein